MDLKIEKFVTGPIETNTYVVSYDTQKCIVIDPSSECDALLEHIKNSNGKITAICLTHGHFDHFMGIEEILAAFPAADVWIHHDEVLLLRKAEYNGSFMLGTQLVYDGAVKEFSEGLVTVHGLEINVYHIAGHSPGGCAFIIGKHCFSGDALFAGSIGRTDFYGCDANILLNNVRKKLFSLPDETIVYPGHGGRTTIGREKRMNPFFQ